MLKESLSYKDPNKKAFENEVIKALTQIGNKYEGVGDDDYVQALVLFITDYFEKGIRESYEEGEFADKKLTELVDRYLSGLAKLFKEADSSDFSRACNTFIRSHFSRNESFKRKHTNTRRLKESANLTRLNAKYDDDLGYMFNDLIHKEAKK